MPAPLVVTRPQPDAGQWVAQLQSAGITACALPLMDIGPSRSPAAVAAMQRAVQHLQHYHALMFVSGNAVRYFFAHLHAQGVQPSTTAQYWSPGPGTSKALLSAGVARSAIIAPAADAPQFDSESLWQQAQHHIHTGQRVLLVRGGDGSHSEGQGRQWLTEQLQQRGVHVDFAPAYERQAPATTPALLAHIEALRQQNALWLFSSSECLHHLLCCQPTWSWHTHTALVTHPRIGQRARQAGFGHVVETLPTLPTIAASIKSLHDLS